MEVPNTKGHTSNLWGKCPLYGGHATGGLISWEIHYRPFVNKAQQATLNWLKHPTSF